jgi:protein-tyrosine phosphatase
MREAREVVAERYGAAYAQSLCVTNPLAVFEGREFTVDEEPRGLLEEVKVPGFWQRAASMLTRR